MSGWKRLLEQESEHQWLAFLSFTLIIITGSVIIDWSNDLSGVRNSSTLNVDGMVLDTAGDIVLFEDDSGVKINSESTGLNQNSITCLSAYGGITYACTGESGEVSYIEDGNLLCEDNWCSLSLGENVTVKDLSANVLDSIEGTSQSNPALLMIIQDGTSNALAAKIHNSNKSIEISSVDGEMFLDVMIPTRDGWLVGGAWQAPPNWLGTNPVSPPMFELLISVHWDGVTNPNIDLVYTGNEGRIHGIFSTESGYVATGTSDTLYVNDGVITEYGLGSYSSVGDRNGDIWLFSGIGSSTVAIISEGSVVTEKLPEPLSILPEFVTCDDEGMISIHGVDSSDNPKAITIDSNARQSFTSIRGIIDLCFILVSMIVIGTMVWNISDAIRKGEVF